jgi:hypothetical protein
MLRETILKFNLCEWRMQKFFCRMENALKKIKKETACTSSH